MGHHQNLQNVIEDQVCAILCNDHYEYSLTIAESSSNELPEDSLPCSTRHIQEDSGG